MKTLVLGASPNPERYSYKAVRMLKHYDHFVVPVGIRKGKIEDIEIILGQPKLKDIDTISLYLGKDNQIKYYDYITSLKPKRIIFNPGTENNELMKIVEKMKIETVINCTLVMLSKGIY